ncbi:MAG TPA: hypothetical protein VMZ26_12845 [Pyrinomonadaceae bacterium]|nr:hypothetical protein [Pyrinomonadaceae bacterium]
MFAIPSRRIMRLRFLCVLTLVCFMTATSGYAQTSPSRTYDVELMVPKDKKTVETDADITFEQTTFKVVPDKADFKGETREIAYADIKQADHSYSKKPMLSGGGAIATALLVGFIFAIPFLFIKKKKHWMSVQAGDKFAVIKLGDQNFRQIVAEFEAHGVKVNDLKDESKK